MNESSETRVRIPRDAIETLNRGLDTLDELLFKEGSAKWAGVAGAHIERLLRIVNDRTQQDRRSRDDEETGGSGTLAEAEKVFRELDIDNDNEYLTQVGMFYTQRISARLPGGPTGIRVEN